MNTRPEIEARLDRSLANQLRMPKLDRRFDAAVWARIEAETSASRAVLAMPRESAAARWMFASNAVGFLVAAMLVLYFGARMFTGVEVELPVPSLSWSPEQTNATLKFVGWVLAFGAIGFGLMFTSLGRRLRSEIAALY